MSAGPTIIGIDFSDSSLEAVPWAARHLTGDSPLVLVHAVHIPAPPRFLRGMFPPLEPMVEDAKRGAEIRLAELAATLDAPAVTEVRVGRAEDVLAALATEIRAELVVVGAQRERSGVWGVLGSTVERVVRRAPCSLLLARGLPSGAMRKALVAVDDSEMGPAVLRSAVQFSAGEAGRVVLLHVVSGALAGAVRMGARGKEARRGEQSLREHAEHWLRERAEEAGLAEATRVVTLGDVGAEIVRAARRHRVDLVVIGAHGESHGPFLGSAAEFVLRQGSGPVLVVRTVATAAGPTETTTASFGV